VQRISFTPYHHNQQKDDDYYKTRRSVVRIHRLVGGYVPKALTVTVLYLKKMSNNQHRALLGIVRLFILGFNVVCGIKATASISLRENHQEQSHSTTRTRSSPRVPRASNKNAGRDEERPSTAADHQTHLRRDLLHQDGTLLEEDQPQEQPPPFPLSPESRVIAGIDAGVGRHPYMVALYDTAINLYHPVCGGVLVSANIVLTAAHCIDRIDAALIGATSVSGNVRTTLGQVHELHDGIKEEQKIAHPFFEKYRLYFDYALILLDRPSVHDPIQMNEDTSLPHIGEMLTLLGWGGMHPDYIVLPYHLMRADVAVISQHECELKYVPTNYYSLLSENVLCAHTKGKDACQGDSGGPLIQKGANVQEDVLFAIVSWGYGCATGYPGVYSQASPIVEWIKGYII
jgi:trypsin